jgi:hypothetical protein
MQRANDSNMSSANRDTLHCVDNTARTRHLSIVWSRGPVTSQSLPTFIRRVRKDFLGVPLRRAVRPPRNADTRSRLNAMLLWFWRGAPSFMSSSSRERSIVAICLRRTHSHLSLRRRMARSLQGIVAHTRHAGQTPERVFLWQILLQKWVL